MKKETSLTTIPDYKILFESIPGLYMILSASLHIITVSDAYAKATKTKREDISGRHLFEVFPDNPDDPNATGVGNLHASLKRVLQKKLPDTMAVQKYDIQRPQSEGGGFEERYWSPMNCPVLDADNNVQYIIHRAEDVTEFVRLKQKRSEQDKFTEDLLERTEMMENEIYLRAQELQITNEKLRESEKLKDQFLANMSHEIRTPMNAIIGFSDLLEKTDMDERQKEFNNAIKESGQNLLSIINDILDFSKIEAGMIEFENTPFSLRSLVDSVFRLLVNKANAKNIEFYENFDANIHEVLIGDPTRVTQILVNLLGNAIKFTDKGYVKLDINLKTRNEEYRVIEFRVEDSGIGIDPEKMNSIFDRFIQASSDTNRKYGGTGLGLSIVKNLVELQGGKIDVQSEPGEGSVFSITIPFKVVSYEELSQYKASEKDDGTNELIGVKVLVAEDNKMNQRLAIEVLSSFGVTIDLAENGREAIKKLKEKSCDIILMDMQMAEMDGYEATTYIRQTLKNNIPIIAMTAHAMYGEKEKCLALGMNDYISKPFKTAELYKKIKAQLNLKTGKINDEINHPKTNGTSVVDLGYLKKIRSSGNSFVLEMINMFLDEVPQWMQTMETALEKKEYDTVRKAAHKIQTSSGMMGISVLTETLIQIQDKCVTNTGINEIPAIFSKAKYTCMLAVKELEEEKRKIES